MRESTNRQACRANLKQIAVALHAYHDRYESFPPAYIVGPDGQSFHSWRVLLLPFLGEQELYDLYHFDEPWNGPHNRTLTSKIPEFYACPAADGRRAGVTNFLAVVGRQTAWPEQYCARMQNFADGTSSTLQLLEASESDVLWLEPRDLSYQEAIARGPIGEATSSSRQKSGSSGFLIAIADGSVRFLSHQVSRELFRSLLSINGGRALAGVEWPPTDIPEPAELPAARPAGEFPATDVLPYPTGPLIPGRNYVYCATFEIAWDEARIALGGNPLVLVDRPSLSEALNAHSFQRRNLSPDSYMACGGPGTNELVARIKEELARKFPGNTARAVDQVHGEHVLLLHAYLLKSLRFETAFDALAEPLRIRTAGGDMPVRSFGFSRLDDSDARGEQLQAQVHVLDYRTDDDFVVRLAAARTDDEIVLAKLTPLKTLDETIAAVRDRIMRPDSRHTEQRIVNEESLMIPRLVVSVERHYSEIIDHDIVGTPLPMHVGEAVQVVRFGLDETGAQLESEAVVIGDDDPFAGRRSPPGKRKFIFDRPFLIYLIERNADQPYFAAWIENAELLETVSQ